MPLSKAVIINAEKKGFEPISVMFNPPSLKIKSTTKYVDQKTQNETPGKDIQFVGGTHDTLTVELFFDTTHDGTDVRAAVDPILDLAKVTKDKVTDKDKDKDKDKKSPPKLVFAWGDFNFPCYIVSTDQTYDYFDSAGRALRATLVMTFARCDLDPSTNSSVSKGKSTVEKIISTVMVKSEQALSDIADCVGIEPEKWRLLALVNEIDNPFTFNAGEMIGRLLKIP